MYVRVYTRASERAKQIDLDSSAFLGVFTAYQYIIEQWIDG